MATIIDKNTLSLHTAGKGSTPIEVKAKNILISVGGRPKFLDHIDQKLVITSDDLFSLEKPPGNLLSI